MPTYQYACTTCGHQLEAVQSFADDPLTECPACEGRLRKLFSAVGIVFKGSGFYRNDSRQAAKSGADSGNGSSNGGTPGETKAAPAKESKEKTAASSGSGSSGSGSSGSGSSEKKAAASSAGAATT